MTKVDQCTDESKEACDEYVCVSACNKRTWLIYFTYGDLIYCGRRTLPKGGEYYIS